MIKKIYLKYLEYLDFFLKRLLTFNFFKFLYKKYKQFEKYLDGLNERTKVFLGYLFLILGLIFMLIPFINGIVFLFLSYRLLRKQIKKHTYLRKIFHKFKVDTKKDLD